MTVNVMLTLSSVLLCPPFQYLSHAEISHAIISHATISHATISHATISHATIYHATVSCAAISRTAISLATNHYIDIQKSGIIAVQYSAMN